MQVSPQQSTQQKVRRYHCPGCGADLLFEPKGGALQCPYCGHVERIPQTDEKIEERSYEQYLRLRPEQMQAMAPNALEVQCTSCGALVTFTPPEVARTCDFCGAAIVAQPKTADPILSPEAVLPFRIHKQQATAAIRQWISSRWFAPTALKQFASHEGIDGVYLPYWTYDAYTTSHYKGERGEHYYETEHYTEKDSQGNSVSRSRQVRRTRWYNASGTVDRWFDDILIPATRSLPQNRLVALEPWDLVEIKPYDPAFLSGYKAQRYQVGLPEGFELAKQVAARAIEADVRSDIGGDEQRIHNISTHYSGITFKHIMLPVYVGAYRLNQKLYQVVVNGRTGEVQGDRPYSWVKITLFVLTILFVIGFCALVGAIVKS